MRHRILATTTICVALIPLMAGANGPPQVSLVDVPPSDRRLRFEVASVKRNELGPGSFLLGFRNGRFTARYATLLWMVRTAYGQPERPLTESQVVGGPPWLRLDRFDVEATAPGTPHSPRGTFTAPVIAMVRTLVEERFALKTHIESREYPLLALVLARSDGRLGPGLRRRGVECTAAPVGIAPSLSDRQACIGRTGPGMLMARGATIGLLINGLSLLPGIDRIIVDRTGLTGTFDVDLRWTPEAAPTGGVTDPGPAPSADLNALPSLATALQEQLGLKLERTTGPVVVLVVDHAEPPTPN
jgi:uncharacterized protein (TIGR03435 family)